MLASATFITIYFHVPGYPIHVIFCVAFLIAGLLDNSPQETWEKRQQRIENVTSLIFSQLDTSVNEVTI